MRSTLRSLLALAAALTLVFAIAACGDDDNGGGGGGSEQSGDAAGGKTGGTATAVLTSYPDYMDPALSYTQEGWQTLWTVYTPLLTYNHAEGAEGAQVIPGLAEALPEITNGGKTYKLKMREGLKYSDGTPVKASDFERTIQRVLNLESGGASFYTDASFGGIVGAEEYVKAGKAKADIEGIVTDDAAGTIEINLQQPNGAFPYILAMDFAAVVPGDTPFENTSKNPPAGVGPFKLENVRQNRGYTLARNENWPKIDGIPEAKLDSIQVDVVKNRRRQTQDTIRNEIDLMTDPPAADQIREVKDGYKERYKEYVTNSTYYLFMNNRVAPFDKKEVREAVNLAIDKTALARFFGGLLEPGCNFLPPGMQGYEKVEPCPFGEPAQKPSPENIQKAKDLVKQAGAEGEKVTMYGNDEPESSAVAQYVAGVLDDIGLDGQEKILEGSVYFQAIGNQKTKAQIGFANWFQDFPHPQNFTFLVDPASIQETNNQNFGNVDDPQIGTTLKAANQQDIEEAAPQYAEVDKRLVEESLVAPYGHRKLATFVSDKVDFENCTVVHPVYQIDLTQLCVK